MFIGSVGLWCAGDPLAADLMAVGVAAVNQHGTAQDLAGAPCGAEAIPAGWRETVLWPNAWLELREKSDRPSAIVRRRLERRAKAAQAVLAEA